MIAQAPVAVPTKSGAGALKLGCGEQFIAFFCLVALYVAVGKGCEKKPADGPPRHTLDSAVNVQSAESHWHIAARRFVEGRVSDTLSLQYYDWKDFVSDPRHITTADIVSKNEFGKSVKQRWVFSFDNSTRDLKYVMIDGKTVFDADP